MLNVMWIYMYLVFRIWWRFFRRFLHPNGIKNDKFKDICISSIHFDNIVANMHDDNEDMMIMKMCGIHKTRLPLVNVGWPIFIGRVRFRWTFTSHNWTFDSFILFRFLQILSRMCVYVCVCFLLLFSVFCLEVNK